MKFIKAHWRELIMFALAGLIMFLYLSWENSLDDSMAQMMADRVVANQRAQRKEIEDKFAILNAAKDQELVGLKTGWAADKAKVQAWRRQSEAAQAKVKTLEGCMVLLDDCQANAAFFDSILSARVDGVFRWAAEKDALRVDEIDAWKAKDTKTTTLLGNMAKALYAAELRARRKLIIGPQVGYGPGGAYVGFGATYELIRLKVPGSLL